MIFAEILGDGLSNLLSVSLITPLHSDTDCLINEDAFVDLDRELLFKSN